ncbi:protein lev-9-like [Mobula birostris]|uniref:protein lev-9-like n=1 Tax=Mobula birostris TaxID=1983395 RepID=UPI003B28BD68
MGFACLRLLLCLLYLHAAAEGRRSNGRVLNEMCPARNLSEVSISGQVCSRGCLRDQDCRRRQCHCDGACGLSCVRKGRSCPWPVSVDNAAVRLLGGGRPRFNHWLEVSCLPGFVTQAGPAVSRHRCQGDRRWSGSMPECQARKSPKPFYGLPPALPHGVYQVLDHSSGSSIKYKCNPGETDEKCTRCLRCGCARDTDIGNGQGVLRVGLTQEYGNRSCAQC